MNLLKQIMYVLYEDTDANGKEVENNLEKITEDFAVLFSEWLIKKCDFQKHGVWLYRGMEMTNRELLEVFKNDVW